MRSQGYRKCRTCDTTVRDGRRIYCGPCADKRREEREAKYRKARQAAKRLALLAWLLIPVAASAEDYVMPRIPTEAEKIEALRLAYILNGFSMTRELSAGSIDVSQLMNPVLTPGVVRTIPIKPDKRK